MASLYDLKTPKRVKYISDYDYEKNIYYITKVLCPSCKRPLFFCNYEYDMPQKYNEHTRKKLENMLLDTVNKKLKEKKTTCCPHCRQELDLSNAENYD